MKMLWTILIVGVLAACVTTPTSEETLAQLNAHLDTCTNQYGYDRKNTDALGPYELGKNEKDWRICAYAGIEKHLVPHTSDPALYRQIITEDREMTDKVEQKSMTRAERRARLDELVSLIEEQDEKQAEINRRTYQQQRMSHVGVIRGFR